TFVSTPPPLSVCSAELRGELVTTLLDVLRRNLAIKVDVLDPLKQRDLVDQTQPRLLDGTVWYLDELRELVQSDVAYPRPKRPGESSGFYISSYGSYGRYLRRSLKEFVLSGEVFGRTEVDAAIQFLLLALKRYGIVEQVRSGDVPGYQINPDALRWVAGN